MGELGIVHRYESSGEIHGIIRPREFTQDDAHIYCTPDQVKEEIKKVMDLCFEIYKTYGLKLDHLELSTRPENSIGSDEVWEKAESIMKQILTEGDTPYQINEGDGAFYGPKFDFHLKDCVGRTWQCSTIQLDFAQPKNFNLEYTAEDGTKQQPVMIHRVLYGSVERFLGILIENCAGAFPLWLSPVQAKIIPITDAQHDYANKILIELKGQGIRAEIDDRSEKMQAKIRNAQLQKIPYMLIIGKREVESNSVSVRQRDEQDLGAMPFIEFLAKVKEQISTRSLNLIK
jgi:threonyl-tRNA synthetase